MSERWKFFSDTNESQFIDLLEERGLSYTIRDYVVQINEDQADLFIEQAALELGGQRSPSNEEAA